MTTKQNKGFTLLEILLVIAAIGILAAIVLVAINPNRQIAQARNTVRQADINTIQKAVEQYLIENGSYPSSISTTPGYICNTGTEQVNGSTNCSGRVDLRELVPDYIAGIPKDPQATGTNTGYNIAINPDNNKVSIQASLSERGILVINPLSIVTNGLVLNLDAGNPASYPGTGTTWFDLSGNNNNGTLVNGVGYNTANGGSLSFDGLDGRVSIPDISFSSSGFSFGFILNYNSSQSVQFPRILAGNVEQELESTFYHMKFRWPGGGAIISKDNFIIPNSINYYFITYSSPFLLFYRNGILFDTKSVSSSGTATYNSLMNRSDLVRPLNGNLYCSLLYNRALTPEEIQQNFNATRGRFGL
jgi:prepilin-type N-terminal cleavage/methylation domain-containing protein